MKKLNLLFVKNGLISQIIQNKQMMVEDIYMPEEFSEQLIYEKLNDLLFNNLFEEVQVISALNHFSMVSADFEAHQLGYQLISYNAPVNEDKEELMLSKNTKYDVQFYFTLPKIYYKKVKLLNTKYNFSGEKFLNSIKTSKDKEIHIHLYHNQCEFIATDKGKVVLYNNLDVNSEVDFLYFIMFSLEKIGFKVNDTQFFVYGETKENDTFISELAKFVTHLKVVFENKPQQQFILNL